MIKLSKVSYSLITCSINIHLVPLVDSGYKSSLDRQFYTGLQVCGPQSIIDSRESSRVPCRSSLSFVSIFVTSGICFRYQMFSVCFLTFSDRHVLVNHTSFIGVYRINKGSGNTKSVSFYQLQVLLIK